MSLLFFKILDRDRASARQSAGCWVGRGPPEDAANLTKKKSFSVTLPCPISPVAGSPGHALDNIIKWLIKWALPGEW
jgi:hypothetical protein